MRIIALIVLFFVLAFGGSAWAVDTLLCADNDDNGVVDSIKASGQVDRDCDGELSLAMGGGDCDDTDARVKNLSYVRVDATNYKQCINGTYTDNTSAQLCERGTCYYVNPATGSDSNPCTWAAPCATFTKLTAGGSIAMAGDTAIYLMGATNLTTAVARTPDGGDSCNRVGIETETAGTSSSSKNLIALYPTSTAKIVLNCTSTGADCCSAIKLAHNHWTVRDLDIGNHYGTGIWKTAGTSAEIDNVYIHDITCNATDNCAGIKVADGSNDIDVHHSIINDIYDPTKTLISSDRQNVKEITFFGNSENQIARYNRIGYSKLPETSLFQIGGNGLGWKHGNAPAGMTLENKGYGNIIYNAERAIMINGAKTRAYGNLIHNAIFGVETYDAGGGDGYFFDGIYVDGNTISSVDGASTQGVINFTNAPTTTTTIQNYLIDNVVVDTQAAYSGGETVMVKVFQYGSDAMFTALITNDLLAVSGNCYYNATVGAGLANGFGVFSDNGSTSFGSLVNFANWKATYGLDSSPLGYNENPTLDANFKATSANCLLKGWEKYWPSSSSSASARKGQKYGSGRKGQK